MLPPWLLGRDDNEFEVYAVNVPAFELWSRMATQWRVAGMGGEIGLDYAVAFGIMDRMCMDLPDQLTLLDRLRYIEGGYLEYRNKKARKKKLNQQGNQAGSKS